MLPHVRYEKQGTNCNQTRCVELDREKHHRYNCSSFKALTRVKRLVCVCRPGSRKKTCASKRSASPTLHCTDYKTKMPIVFYCCMYQIITIFLRLSVRCMHAKKTALCKMDGRNRISNQWRLWNLIAGSTNVRMGPANESPRSLWPRTEQQQYMCNNNNTTTTAKNSGNIHS